MTRFTRRELDAINEALAFRLAGTYDGETEEETTRMIEDAEAAQAKVIARLKRLDEHALRRIGAYDARAYNSRRRHE